MRIAVSGTHGSGKSTLIDMFLIAHPDYAHEPEPYVVLTEDYGEIFASQPAGEDFCRQLDFNVGRLRSRSTGDRVIHERCPLDFLAYMLALNDLRREATAHIVAISLAKVIETLPLLDVIVFLPLDEILERRVSRWEDHELRDATNDRLIGILLDDDFELFTSDRPMVVEAAGSTAERLKILEGALRSGADS